MLCMYYVHTIEYCVGYVLLCSVLFYIEVVWGGMSMSYLYKLCVHYCIYLVQYV